MDHPVGSRAQRARFTVAGPGAAGYRLCV